MQKNQLISSVHSWDTVNFRVQRPHWPYPVLNMPNQKIFNQLLTLANLYQHSKNEAVSSICSGEILDLKLLQCVPKHFCLYLRNKIFLKYRICAETFWKFSLQIQWKLMTKNKKPYFWPIFGPFLQVWEQKKFFKKIRQTAGGKDGWILFHRILPANNRDLTSTTTEDWYLKVKDIEYDADLAQNYCITVSM